MPSIAEIRFNCEPHDLEPEQVQAILEAHDAELDIDVGLGREGKAAVTFDTDDTPEAVNVVDEVTTTCRNLGLEVLDVEIVPLAQYEQRAWVEAQIDPENG